MKKLFLFVLLIFALCAPTAVGAGNFYVFSTADPGGDGTLETPWDSLSDISTANGVTAGSTVYIDGTFSGQSTGTISSGGTSEDPIIFTAYNSSNKPVIDGRWDLGNTGWTDLGSGCYSKTGYSTSPHIFIESDGDEDVALKIASDSGSGVCSGWSDVNWYYDEGNSKIFYKPTSGTPADYDLYGIRYRWLTHDNDLSYIEVHYLNIKYYAWGFRGRGSSSGCSNMAGLHFTNNKIENCRLGVYIFPNGGCTADDILFENNDVLYSGIGFGAASDAYGPEQISNVTAQNNTFTYGGLVNAYSGEWIDRTDDTQYLSGFNGDLEQITMANVDGAIVTGNYISGHTRGIVLFNNSGMYTRDIQIYGNVFDGCTYTGVWSASITANVLDDHYTDIDIFSNLFINNGNGQGGGDEGEYPDLQRAGVMAAGYYKGSNAIFKIANNTFFENYRGVRTEEYYSDNITMLNNIFVDSTLAHVIVQDGLTGLSINNNLYYHTGSCSASTCWYLTDDWVSFATWDDTHDTNGIEGEDPLFFNADNDDLRLLPNSPAIDAGTNPGISGWRDKDGRPVFGGYPIGAYEYYWTVIR